MGNASKTKTDNDHSATKVALRVEAVTMLGEPREIRLLDAFHGYGKLWQLVAAVLAPDGWSIKPYRVDHQVRGAGTLHVDNDRLMRSIDLRRFDLIDLDAYGWPAKQLKIVSQRAPKTPVLSTRIARALGPMPKVVLNDLGITIAADGPKVLYERIADELWEAWLYRLGYRTSRLVRFEHAGLVKRYELLIP